ncbi:hypothetical protein [Coleofasciculus sp. FACHB-1120]|uniref:hypothetical protein n=1 Tax=Coleofasciculus sp. FACHB-1120 TaxID=2692783 RepID=UPI0016884B32|nr:hypothetical protein [Coleofasciculus sp. FACHB-1120]MBD2743599.1 hypothetical protein [Coleofasciculus sp. FACHB-1120]
MGTEKGSRKSRRRDTSFQLEGVSVNLKEPFLVTVLGVFMVVRGGMFFLNPQLATLECDRLQSLAMCKLVVSSLRGETVTPFPLDRLEKATVQKHGKSNQLVLLTSDDENLYFPMNNSFSFTESKASQINEFVQDPKAKSLKLEQDSRWFAYPLGASLIMLGSLSLWFTLKDFLD